MYSGMASACEIAGIVVSRAKIREWLVQLEGYSLIKVDEKREKDTRVTIIINSKEI